MHNTQSTIPQNNQAQVHHGHQASTAQMTTVYPMQNHAPQQNFRQDIDLGRVLMDEGYVTTEEIHRGITNAEGCSAFLQLLLYCPMVSELELATVLASRHQVPMLNLDVMQVPQNVLNLLPHQIALELECLPIARLGHLICVATPNIRDRERLHRLRSALRGARVKLFPCDRDQLFRHLSAYYSPPAVQNSSAQTTQFYQPPNRAPENHNPFQNVPTEKTLNPSSKEPVFQEKETQPLIQPDIKSEKISQAPLEGRTKTSKDTDALVPLKELENQSVQPETTEENLLGKLNGTQKNTDSDDQELSTDMLGGTKDNLDISDPLSEIENIEITTHENEFDALPETEREDGANVNLAASNPPSEHNHEKGLDDLLIADQEERTNHDVPFSDTLPEIENSEIPDHEDELDDLLEAVANEVEEQNDFDFIRAESITEKIFQASSDQLEDSVIQNWEKIHFSHAPARAEPVCIGFPAFDSSDNFSISFDME